MSVEFDEDVYGKNQYAGFRSPASQQPTKGSGMTNALVRMGLAKDESSATVILIIIMICVFGLSFYFFKFGFHLPTLSKPVSGPQEFPPGLELK